MNDPPFIGLMVGTETIEPPIQYSDSITDAPIAYGDIDTAVDEDNIWTKYTFIPAGGVTASEEIDGLPTGLELVSVSPPNALSAQGQVKLSGRMMVPPGTYTISIGIDDGDPLGALEDSFSIEYEVITETIDTGYVGDPRVLTAGPTTDTASVLLQAQLTQKDVELGSYFVGATDHVGVRWQVFTAANATATPDFVFPPMDQNPVLVDTNGRAQLQVPLKVGGYRLKVVLVPNTYWSLATSNEASVNVVVGTSNRRLTGGGWITDAGSSNRRGSFTFSVTALRTGAVTGSLSYSYRDASGFTWKVSVTSWQPGSLTYYTDPGRATLQGKAMVQKINSLGKVVGEWRDYSIAASIYDGAALRTFDRFGVLVTAPDGSIWRRVPPEANVLAGEGLRIGGGSISVYRW